MTRPARSGATRPRSGVMVLRAGLLFALSAGTGSPAGASILAEVLGWIAELGRSPLAAVMVNAAINEPVPTVAPRGLEAGQRVILGYDPQGRAVETVAGADGVRVTAELAQAMEGGLAAGLYPPGSALYSLPPAGQLSLYEADRHGNRLDRAMAASLAVVNGSITNIVDGILLPDLAPVQVLAVDLGGVQHRALDMERISTTVLGAVNSGEIVAAVDVVTDAGGAWQVDLDRARIATGGSAALAGSAAGEAVAVAMATREIGGGPEARAIAANLSMNLSGVNGRVTTIVTGQTTTIRSVTVTVIGAVNAGSVAQDRMADEGIQR